MRDSATLICCGERDAQRAQPNSRKFQVQQGCRGSCVDAVIANARRSWPRACERALAILNQSAKKIPRLVANVVGIKTCSHALNLSAESRTRQGRSLSISYRRTCQTTKGAAHC